MHAKIDFLTATFTQHDQDINPLPWGIGFGGSKKRPTDAPRFDTEHLLYPAGKVLIQETNEPLFLWQFTGADMRVLRGDKQLHDDLITYIATGATNTTRLDIAIDTDNPSASPTSALHAYQSGEAVTRVQTVTEYRKTDTGKRMGHTVYFGSPKGDRFLRVYDKAAELALDLDQVLTRAELQTRKKRANPLMQDILKHGLQAAAETAIKKVINFPTLEWWRELFTEQAINATEIPNAIGAWSKWLNGQVLDSIMNRYGQNERDDRQAIAQFIKSLETAGIINRETNSDKC